MRFLKTSSLGLALVGSGLFAFAAARADEPGRLGRLFRFGGENNPAAKSKESTQDPHALPTSTAPVNAIPASALNAAPVGPASNAPAQRIAPQPRTSKAVTEADPILTRISLGRADNSSQFAMFLQIYADGTVIDSEGVHHVKPELLKPIYDHLQSADISRLKGHCGGPPTDYIEQVLYTVYDRSMGKVRATTFSFSGNPQGCSPIVKHLNAAVDELQMKLQGPAVAAAPAHQPAAHNHGMARTGQVQAKPNAPAISLSNP